MSDEWRIYDYAIKGVMYVCRDVFRIVEIIDHKVGLTAPLLIKIKQSTVLPQLGVLHDHLDIAWNGPNAWQALVGSCGSSVCCTPDTRSRSRFIGEHTVKSERATHSIKNVEQYLHCNYVLDHLGQ